MIYAFTAIKMRRYPCYLTRNMNVPKIKISFLLHPSSMIMKSESFFYKFLSMRTLHIFFKIYILLCITNYTYHRFMVDTLDYFLDVYKYIPSGYLIIYLNQLIIRSMINKFCVTCLKR